VARRPAGDHRPTEAIPVHVALANKHGTLDYCAAIEERVRPERNEPIKA
jgi:hypothetical protein